MITYQNATFIESVFELVTAKNFSFFENFKRIHLLRVFLLDQEHLTITTLTNDLDRAEVAHSDCARSRLRSITKLFHLVY